MFNSYNRVDNILLHDFKENVKLDPSVNYRFFFKSQEPEFGYLKEEVFKKLFYYYLRYIYQKNLNRYFIFFKDIE